MLSGKTPELLSSLPEYLLKINPQEKQIKLNEAIKMLDKIGTKGKVATTTTGNKYYTSLAGNTSLNPDEFPDVHAYTIVKTDPIHKTVTLKNPYDTSKNLTITYEKFLNNFKKVALEK